MLARLAFERITDTPGPLRPFPLYVALPLGLAFDMLWNPPTLGDGTPDSPEAIVNGYGTAKSWAPKKRSPSPRPRRHRNHRHLRQRSL